MFCEPRAVNDDKLTRQAEISSNCNSDKIFQELSKEYLNRFCFMGHLKIRMPTSYFKIMLKQSTLSGFCKSVRIGDNLFISAVALDIKVSILLSCMLS